MDSGIKLSLDLMVPQERQMCVHKGIPLAKVIITLHIPTYDSG